MLNVYETGFGNEMFERLSFFHRTRGVIFPSRVAETSRGVTHPFRLSKCTRILTRVCLLAVFPCLRIGFWSTDDSGEYRILSDCWSPGDRSNYLRKSIPGCKRVRLVWSRWLPVGWSNYLRKSIPGCIRVRLVWSRWLPVGWHPGLCQCTHIHTHKSSSRSLISMVRATADFPHYPGLEW